MKLAAPLIFLGSFLSFFVEPLVGRTLLPWFGGGASVWVTCLVGFQLLMVAGYFYGGKVRVRVHVPLLAGAAVWCVVVAAVRRPVLSALAGLSGVPAVDVLLGVLFLSALAFVLLSANATLVQMLAGGDYRLYSVSNLGSLCGLMAYPLAVEPFVAVPWQWVGLGVAIVVYGVGLVAMTRGETAGMVGEVTRRDAASTMEADAGTVGEAWLWFVLPATSCALMTAVTTHLTTDFVPLPLMWAVLLAAFLMSYVIGFSRLGGDFAEAWAGAAVLALGLAAGALLPISDNIYRFYWNAGAAAALLLVVATALHSWLYRIRPGREALPRFYLAIAVGGAVGGSAAGLLPPLVFTQVWEYPIALLVCCALFARLLMERGGKGRVALRRIGLGLLAVSAWMIVHGMTHSEDSSAEVLCRLRGFYGANEVTNAKVFYGTEGKKGDLHVFRNGRTEHGAQLWVEGEMQKPRSYFSLNGGAVPFLEHPKRKAGQPIRAAVVGMGIASLAASGERGDYMRFYEISPEVVALATNRAYFTYLADSKATCEIAFGDARLELEKDLAAGIGKFDIIVIDAYSGDSIPTHLVTAEAFRLYRALLAEGGTIACHLSNWHMDLWPVMKAAAGMIGLKVFGWVSGPVYTELVCGTYWALMTEEPVDPRLPDGCHIVDFRRVEDRPLITDDCGSLIFNIRFNYFPPYLYE